MALSRFFCFFSLLVFVFSTQAQIPVVVYFADKDTISNEIDWNLYFSEDALKKRSLQKIEFNNYDLPIRQAYIDTLLAQGVEVLHSSRWLNAVLVNWNESNSVQQFLVKNPFVAKLEHLGGRGALKTQSSTDTTFYDSEMMSSEQSHKMIGLDKLFSKGLTGKGISIAVMDAGFVGVDTAIGFSGLMNNSSIKSTINLSNPYASVFDFSEHGTKVLSVLAGQKGNDFNGTAPEADYHLFVTEWIVREEPLEEFLLLEALEYADVAGVWLANISLGYSRFDDSTYNYLPEQLNGKVSILSKAASIASSRGLLVISSAGNEGNSSHPYITTPSDADSTFSVGSIKENGLPANFSSFSVPNAKNVSPNLAAPGFAIAVLNSNSEITKTKGTSFSAPFITGATACLWQAFPQAKASDIYHAVITSAQNYPNAHPQLGYGLPDFEKAFLLLEKMFGRGKE